MLNIYTDSSLIKNKEIVNMPYNDFFIKEEIIKYFNDTDEKITVYTDRKSILRKEKLHDFITGIAGLSNGCKTLLCINYTIKRGTIGKYVFDISSCDESMITYLSKEIAKDIDVYTITNNKEYDFSKFNNINIIQTTKGVKECKI